MQKKDFFYVVLQAGVWRSYGQDCTLLSPDILL
ncbi:hypothetical protein CK1_18430 [Ruminococcus sp. SR1/5]|nr:hypothetical protein CK1_18430 [Ruminococcus sp. SR1/5]